MVSNRDDVIDSRDVIERIEELEELCEGASEHATGWYVDGVDVTEEHDELVVLKALAKEASGYADDWEHGETLIRDSYFEEYAQELAEDIGAVNKDASWPNSCIDWEQAARELQMDYTVVDFDGVTYWVR